MNSMNSVRPSREGDQFHYLWAGRRCLRLLHPTTDLVAISIEGPSSYETSSDNPIEAGVHQIDVAEYHGNEELSTASRVRYVQLKHSSRRPNTKWTLGGLEQTLCGFADRYRQLVKQFGLDNIKERFEFCFISNRPIDSRLTSAVEVMAASEGSHQSGIVEEFKDATCLDGEQLAVFCSILKLQGQHADYWLQRADLQRETNGYLPGNDVEAPVLIKNLVERKATTEGEEDPCIRKTNLLHVLGIQEDAISPAPSRITTTCDVVPRLQEAEIVAQIVNADSSVIIHAEGGVGKSVLSQRIEKNLPTGSIAIVYDCFGNGEYRQRSSSRHRHDGALVQIANELAAIGLCDPLLPVLAATEKDYLRAFRHRVTQSTEVIRSRSTQSLVCIVVDAGDSAEIAAEEFGEDRSFVRDLLREPMPDGSRLVVMSRTERVGYLKPPSRTQKIELKPFTQDETACFLRTVYPDASDSEVDEFHSLTSHNPRVQSKALERPGSISNILLSLGSNPSNVNDTIGNMLDGALTELRKNLGENEQQHVNSLCAALAILSPFIPIQILASISGTEVSAVRSFANDFGGSLLVIGDAVQFQDEPVESWFRTKFKPDKDELAEFISNLQVFAAESAYVAYSLPQLMLDAGQLNELIELALNPRLLPDNEIERRNVLVQRLQFALRASLKECRYLDAAKLAMKAAQETAGDSRRWEMFQYNTDLASRFLSSHQIREIVSRRKFENTWIGSRFVFEAGLLSGSEDHKGETLNRLRIADEWIAHWNRLSKEEREEGNRIEVGDIAEIALARLNVEGPPACSNEISSWAPKTGQYRIGCVVAKRLIDQWRLDDLNSLAQCSLDNVHLLLAINIALWETLQRPQKDVVERCLNMLQYEDVRFSRSNRESEIPAITALVETAASYGLSTNEDLSLLLKKYLPQNPPRILVSWYSEEGPDLIRAYALMSELGNIELNLEDLAHPDLRAKLENEETQRDRSEIQEFKTTVGGLFSWYKLRSCLFESCRKTTGHKELITKIDELVEQTSSMTNTFYHDSLHLTARIALIWFELLVGSNCNNDVALLKFKKWIDTRQRTLNVPTWISLARLASHANGFECLVYEFVQHASKRIENAKEDAKSLADSYLNIAKVILGFDKSESREYFQKAVAVASQIGDEIYGRWQAMTQLGGQASNPDQPDPELAYQFSRCAEISEKYIYDHFDYDGTVEAISGLCPSSCLAIMSRWRERRFGDSKRLLKTAISYLSEHQLIDTKTVASLVCFRGYWDYDKLLNDINEVGYSSGDQQNLLNHLFYYMKFGEHSPAFWETFRDLANARNVDCPDLDRLIDDSQHRELAVNNRTNGGGYLPTGGQDQDVDWDCIFGNLHLPHDLSKAHSNYQHSSIRISRERFVKELVRRIPGNKAVEFIQAYSDATEFDLYDFKTFLETLPETWCSRLAIKTALVELVERYCGRYCMEVSRNRYYQPFPIKLICEATGISESDLMGHVLNAIGKRDAKVDSDQLFTIVGLIAPKLTFAEARDALVFGVDLFDEAMSDEVGDGPWKRDLLPPQDTSKALAGYIWSALAAPQSSLRWESAHVVRGICNLGIRDTFDHLIDFAQKELPVELTRFSGHVTSCV